MKKVEVSEVLNVGQRIARVSTFIDETRRKQADFEDNLVEMKELSKRLTDDTRKLVVRCDTLASCLEEKAPR